MVKIKVVAIEPMGQTEEAKASAKVAWLTYEIDGEVQKPKVRIGTAMGLEIGKEYEGEVIEKEWTPPNSTTPQKQQWFQLPRPKGAGGGPRGTDKERNAVEAAKSESAAIDAILSAVIKVSIFENDATDANLKTNMIRIIGLRSAIERKVQSK